MINLDKFDFSKQCEELEGFIRHMLKGQSDRVVCAVLVEYLRCILSQQENPKEALDEFVYVLSQGIEE